jgi:hypothetical protein
MKAYLDNNVVSSIVRDDAPAESTAIDRLLLAYDQGRIELVTSELTMKEIEGCPQQYRPPLERVFRLLRKVPIVRWDELDHINVIWDGAGCSRADGRETRVCCESAIVRCVPHLR